MVAPAALDLNESEAPPLGPEGDQGQAPHPEPSHNNTEALGDPANEHSRPERQIVEASNDQPLFGSLLAQKRRRQNFQRFMLALSDQQLVTGLAVMIAGYSKRCSMSTYHFNIVSSLAWFSSATHLATLGALREYFVTNPSIRNWRVAGMAALLGLILYAQVVMFSRKDNSLSIQCVLEYPSVSADYPDIIVLAATVGFLVRMYTLRIGRLFSVDPDWSLSVWLVGILIKRLAPESHQSEVAGTASLDVSERGALIRKEQERKRYRRLKDFMVKNRKTALQAYGFALVFMIVELDYAYLSQITTLLFDFVYCIVQIFIMRFSTPMQGISGSQDEMGFGQLMPLLFLILPFLTVLEVYSGKRYEISKLQLSVDTYG